MRRLSVFFLFPLILGGCAWWQPTLKAGKVEVVLRPNRVVESGTVWNRTKPLIVKLHNAQAPDDVMEVSLRAIHDGQSLGLLVRWLDGTPVEPYERTWVLRPGSTQYFLQELPPDTFSIKFRLEGSENACMMTGEEGVYDLWQWRSGWSNISGYADDERMIIRRTPPETGEYHTYAGAVEGPPIFIQVLKDQGTPPYTLADRPRTKQYYILPGLSPQTPTESQADVLAEGVHEAGGYFVEFKRALVDGWKDDFQFEGRGPFHFSIAITNNGEGQSHFTSDLLTLKLE